MFMKMLHSRSTCNYFFKVSNITSYKSETVIILNFQNILLNNLQIKRNSV